MLNRLKRMGPGIIIAAAFIGPGTITTATIAGAGFGYTLLWAVLFSVITTIILQSMAARLGLIGRLGLGDAIVKKITNPAIKLFSVGLVVLAIFVGNSAYEAGNITGAIIGVSNANIPKKLLVAIIGLISFIVLYVGRYKLIERFLMALVAVMGLVFITTAILIHPDIIEIIKGLFTFKVPESSAFTIIGIIGTTVVPYNLFLHASVWKNKQIDQEADSKSFALWDTIISVTLGGIITMAIVICAAVALKGFDSVDNIKDLSIQLVPLLGVNAHIFMGLGFLAAGLSSAITAPLAAAYALSEVFGWSKDLRNLKFRLTWGCVLLVGLFFSMTNLRPTSIIFMAQVANGLLLPIIAIFLLWVMNDSKIMGTSKNSKLNNYLGVSVVLITLILGLKGVLYAMEII